MKNSPVPSFGFLFTLHCITHLHLKLKLGSHSLVCVLSDVSKWFGLVNVISFLENLREPPSVFLPFLDTSGQMLISAFRA